MHLRASATSLVACTLAALLAPALLAQPKIDLLQNNYSYILPGMPNYGIAQGSIFDIFGSGLATATSTLQNVPLPTTLSGTSVSITVNGATTHAILYFVSAAQIAAILPSATPTGDGQITVTVSGQTSAPAAITVVQSAFGLLTLNAVGNGPAAVFDVSSNYVGLTNAARPGDFITLWGSGLGPVTGDETVTQAPVTLTNIPIEVDIGGIPAAIQYYGRSIYPGLDQVNVMVPAGVSGCHVSVVVRSGDIVSNFATIPIASSGRVCAEPVMGMTATRIQTLLSQPAVTRGYLDFVNGGFGVSGAEADATFVRFTSAQYAAKQPFGTVSLNDCTVYNVTNVHFGTPNPIRGILLNAGASINVSTPSASGFGNFSMPFQDGGYTVSGLTNVNGTSFRGSYTFSGSGGPDIGAFTAQVNFPGGASAFNYSTPNHAISVTRSGGLPLTWTQPNNTDPSEFIQIYGFSFTPGSPWGAEFYCYAPLAAGRFTVPPAVLLALPATVSYSAPGILEFDLVLNQTFTAPGVDVGTVSFTLGSSQTFSYQ
ncbi:MAG TPA: hypothetical protein VN841_21545 [Bryobacteraceae bacterium]|nr:hypothetical protein [Bryobacteraceae bacterium]